MSDLRIVCPHCHVTNTLPDRRLGDQPRCGGCHQPLFGSARLGIRSIPTMILFRNGKEVARRSGALTAGDIVRWAQAQLAAAA